MATADFIGKIICGDNVDIMRQMDDDSVDLTVTSPPYDGLRTYNGYSFDFENVARELYRIMKPGGVVVWVVGDATINGSETLTSFKQALFFREIGFNVHDTMIYAKTKPTPQAQHPRYQPEFEYMFVFCKGYPPRVFNPLTVPTKSGGKTVKTSGQRNADDSFRHKNPKEITVAPMKRRGNVWYYANFRPADLPLNAHPAIFPEQLAHDHIISWSDPGDVIFDPFGGSGTTAKMAQISGRRFISVDISEEYCEIARKRIEGITAA